MSLLWIGILLACALVYWKWTEVAFRSLLRWLGARKELNDPLWLRVGKLLEEVSRRQRVPAPELSILPEFSPNALILVAPNGRRHLLLSEGLVRALSSEELEACLALCFAHGLQRSRKLQCRFALVLFPFARLVRRSPAWLRTLLYPWVSACLRPFAGPSAVARADRRASDWVGPHRTAAALQKMAVLARKIPLRRWNIAIDHLYLLAPTVLDGGPFWLFPTQAPMEQRRAELLASASLAKAAPL